MSDRIDHSDPRTILLELAAQYRKHNDPGVSDLYNEQPFPIHMPLGMLRYAQKAADELDAKHQTATDVIKQINAGASEISRIARDISASAVPALAAVGDEYESHLHGHERDAAAPTAFTLFTYTRTFNAIAAATTYTDGVRDISVAKFIEAFGPIEPKP